MRKHLAVTAASITMLGLLAAPAAAHHEHQLVNPGTTVVFRCEPAAAADVHPIHNGLHMAHMRRVAEAAPVTVGRTGGACEY